MKKQIVFLAALVLLLSSCRTLQISDYQRQAPLPTPLPRLDLMVHTESFAAQYAGEMLEKAVINASVSGNGWIPNPLGVYNEVGAPLRDVFVVLGNELTDNLVQSAGARYGHARFKLMHYDRRAPGWGYVIPSVLTLGLANLCGMPANRIRAELELQMEIVDAHDHVIARYRAPGIGKATQAMYRGYSHAGAIRKTNLLALQDAMTKIGAKMSADLPELKEKLTLAGPLAAHSGKSANQ